MIIVCDRLCLQTMKPKTGWRSEISTIASVQIIVVTVFMFLCFISLLRNERPSLVSDDVTVYAKRRQLL
jgi:hypothetical protein